MILTTWEEFWINVGNFFKSVWDFFITPDASGLNILYRILFAIIAIVLGTLLIKLFIAVLKRISGIKKGIKADLSAKNFFIETLKIILYTCLAFAVIALLGIDISGAVGILSAVTVALGLALQDIIGMFASGILIFNTKNFQTGDYIKVNNSFGSEEGTVYRISLLYTTLLNINGQKIHIPNNNITKANLTNYADHTNRRGTIEIQVAYEEDSQKIIDILMDVANKNQTVLEDPKPSVVINGFKDFGVEYSLRFFALLPNYWDTLFALRVEVLEALKNNNIKIVTSTTLTVKEKAN